MSYVRAICDRKAEITRKIGYLKDVYNRGPTVQPDVCNIHSIKIAALILTGRSRVGGQLFIKVLKDGKIYFMSFEIKNYCNENSIKILFQRFFQKVTILPRGSTSQISKS